LIRTREEEEVAVIDGDEPRVGNEFGENVPVDHRHDRIVGACHDQRWLIEERQPGQAGPANCSGQLQVIAIVARPPDVAQMLLDQLGVAAERAAIDVSGDALHIFGILVPARARHP